MLLFWLIMGCTDPAPKVPPDADSGLEGTVTIGTGVDEWEPVEEGDSLIMEHGPQGGWHITGAVRAEGLDPLVKIAFVITDLDTGVEVTDYRYNVLLLQHTEGWYYYPGMIGFLNVDDLEEGDLDTPPELLDGHVLEMAMTLTDAEGRMGADTLTIIAERDPVDIPPDE